MYIFHVSGARQLRVWNRECVLQSTSENVNGLEQASGKAYGKQIIAQVHFEFIIGFEF